MIKWIKDNFFLLLFILAIIAIVCLIFFRSQPNEKPNSLFTNIFTMYYRSLLDGYNKSIDLNKQITSQLDASTELSKKLADQNKRLIDAISGASSDNTQLGNILADCQGLLNQLTKDIRDSKK